MAYHRDEDTDLVYEVDSKGNRCLIKSELSETVAYVRFTNKTNHYVNIWWRDFEGKKKLYVHVKPGKFFDVNTYLTHPWEFTDSHTGELFVVNNSTIFRAPSTIGGTRFRHNWNISIGDRSLRYTCLLAIAALLSSPNDIPRLDLPRELAEDVKQLTMKLRKPLSHVHPCTCELD